MEKQKSNISCKCSEVTLDEFIDCIINKNLLRLLREGEATDEELQAAWEKLYGEYAKLSGNQSHAYLFSLMKAISILRAKFVMVKEFLTLENENAEILYRIGYTGDVNRIIARVKRETIELQGKEKELERIRNGNDGESVSDVNFTSWIVSVSKYMGYRIDRKTTLLSEFLTMNKLMMDELKAKNKQAK